VVVAGRKPALAAPRLKGLSSCVKPRAALEHGLDSDQGA
jgi:hypothetical protein